ncbi:zinc ribbon domain-containing protein [Paenibacillus alba]|uniref:Zinc ribbon domain-containing protein n=1 Tax=Paenibacillus alba TaxID=1197127 RepID=A0ABU6G5E0_9BACL|nr:zinc ribbon domain-containing protein [Paenibacillus alba]MEC0228477.1 zinc ribbon domain-containing protein [Paenibacillus alba]NQX67337.1 zinc ribbon domain-containing protein [Paenibacillus alba]
MSFFDKVKQGATDAAKKAQQTVEITKLKTQISSKEKEIEKHYNLIGESVYAAHLAGNAAQSETDVADLCEGITSIKQEIALIEQKISEARNEKECVCGKVVLADTKFCSVCGHKFYEI